MNKPLNVEVKGISFNNQGACLMLFAIIEEFERRGVAANFLIEYSGTSIKGFPHPLWRKARYVRKGLNLLGPLNLVPAFILNRFKLKKCRDVDVVLDASGFSYGDQWNWKVARDRLGSTIAGLKQRNIPVILLPQALGPFENVDGRSEFVKIAKHADLIFARDEQSLEYASPLTPSEKLFLAPDFTNLIAAKSNHETDALANRPCIVPNTKMLSKTGNSERYIVFLVDAIKYLQQNNEEPFILLHEIADDNDLAQEINRRLKKQVTIISHSDARVLKQVIGKASLMIGSRFHALVSSLSQSVPTIACGWSHKYNALMDDYECSEYLVNLDSDEPQSLITKATAQQKQLQVNAERQKHASRDMWDRVFSVINN